MTGNPFKKDPTPLLWLLLIVLIGVLCVGAVVIDRLNIERFQEDERIQVLQQASIIRARLEGNINANIQSVLGLVSVIAAEPNLQQEKFSRYATQIFQGRNQLRNLGGAPGMVIALMHPLAGNEAAIGLDLAANPAQKAAALTAKETGIITVAGPVNLAQGGQGFIGRIPVFTYTENQEKQFWGLVSAVIDLERFYQESGVFEASIDLVLLGKDGLGAAGDVFYGAPDMLAKDPVLLTVSLPSGSWQMAATPLSGWSLTSPNNVWLRALMASLMLVLIAPVVGLIVNQRARQQEQARLRSLFARSTLGIALCDSSSGYILQLNPTLADLLGLAPNQIPPKKLVDLVQAPTRAPMHWQENLMGMGSGIKIDGYIRSAEGHDIDVQINSVAIDQPGMKNLFWVMIEDISVRMKTSKALLETSQQLQLVVDSTGVGFWDWRIDSDALQVNESWAQLIGFSLPELNHMAAGSWIERVHKDDVHLIYEYIHGANPDEPTTKAIEIRVAHKDGSWVWMLVSGRIAAWRDGKPLRAVGVSLDITAKKQAEVQHRETQQLLEKFFAMTPVFMCIANVQGYFEKVNAMFFEKLGYDEETLLSQPVSYFLHEDDVEIVAEEFKNLSRGEHSVAFKNRYRCVDGSYLQLNWNASFDALTGKVYATAIDITDEIKTQNEILRQQDLLKSMSEQGRIGAWEVNIDDQKVNWSSMTKEIHQVDEAYVPTMEAAIQFFKEGHSRNTLEERISNTSKNGESFREELEIITAKDQPLWVVVTGQAEVVSGNCIRIFGSFQDVHASKVAEKELIAAKDAAEQAVKVKSEFLAMMSHEIRTPLNGVMGMLNLLKRTSLDTTQQHHLDVSLHSANTLLHTINDILDFSKVDAGKLILADQDFDLAQELDNVVQMMALQAESKNLALHLDARQLTPVIVTGDQDRLRQVLVNLMSNAIKFTEQGSVLVTAAMDNTFRRLRVSVKDTGIGIAPEALSELFAPFSQVDASSTRRFEGTGLGLVIARKLCGLMGGDVSVESQEGVGSTFRFDVVFSQVRRNVLADIPCLEKQRVIVISADEYCAGNTKGIVKQLGAQAVIASKVSELEKLLTESKNERYDIAVIDQSAIGDKTLIPRLKQNSVYASTLRWLLLCPQHGLPDFSELQAWGFDAYLPKPITRTAFMKLFSKDTQRILSSERSVAEKSYAGCKLLLVEDNAINQEVASLMLKDVGFEVDVANNGKQAIEMLNKCDSAAPYHLVLMDCLMPDMDGYEASRQIRVGSAGLKAQALPIIALTANAMQGDKERCLEAGMNDFVSKPIDSGMLLITLDRWLNVGMGQANVGREPQVEPTSNAQHIWNKEFALRSVRGRNDRLQWLMQRFLASSDEQVKAMAHAIKISDFTAVNFQAHMLKGSAGQMGCEQVQSLCASLELAAKSTEPSQVATLFSNLARAVAECSALIAKEESTLG